VFVESELPLRMLEKHSIICLPMPHLRGGTEPQKPTDYQNSKQTARVGQNVAANEPHKQTKVTPSMAQNGATYDQKQKTAKTAAPVVIERRHSGFGGYVSLHTNFVYNFISTIKTRHVRYRC
jgi:hypothetical protein